MDSGPLTPVNGQQLTEFHSGAAPEFGRQPGLANVQNLLPSQDSILREYFRVLVKRRWWVLGCLALIFGTVAIATLRATRIYDASGSIAVNRTDPTMMM